MAKRLDAKQLVTNVDKLAAEIKNLNVELKQTVEILSKGQSAFNQASKNQNDLTGKTNKVKKATSELEKIQARSNKVTLETVRATEKLRQKRKALTDQVKKEQGTFKKSTGLIKSMAKSALIAGAAFLGFRAAINVFKKVITTLKDFEKAMSKVRAITKATDKEFKELRKNALRLGSTTSKTATQVAELQTEFAKLGFSTAEILAATEATISLSIAAGTDLAEAAVVAASTVRGFGLSANETQRVVDVMAESFASSALDMEKFKVAMAKVAPIARASGKSIEFTTAQLGILSDAGLEASIAGTSLRNIFLELSKQGLTWEEGLEKINTSTNKNNTALQLFGKRSATAGLILADNIKKAGEFEIALDGAAGSAKDMADIMEDNLSGELVRTQSKWEGFIQSLENGEGGLATATRGLVKLWGVVAEGFEILSGGQAAFLEKQLKQIYSDDINKSVAENLRLRKEEVGVDQALLELKEDEANNIIYINELEQQLLETSDRRRDKEKKRVLEQELIETKVLADILAKTLSSEEDAKQASIDAETEASRVKAQIAEDAAKKSADEQLKIDEELYDDKAKAFQAARDKQEQAESQADQDRLEREKEQLIDQLAEEYELKVLAAEKELLLAEATAEQKKKVKIAAVEAAEQIVSDRLSIGIDENLAKFQSEQDAASDILKDRLDKGEISEEEYAGKIAEIERKGRIESAKAEKKKAILDATLAAAVSVIKQLAATPLPLGAPFIATAAKIGALQIGVAAAIPIPKFKQGGTMKKDGLAQFSEEGSELAILPSGKAVLTPVEETISMIPKGTTFFKHDSPETQAALSGGMTQEMYQGLVKEQQLTRKAIQAKNVQPIYTPKGLKYRDEETNTDINWIKNTMM